MLIGTCVCSGVVGVGVDSRDGIMHVIYSQSLGRLLKAELVVHRPQHSRRDHKKNLIPLFVRGWYLKGVK
jgi:hypothetical protein